MARLSLLLPPWGTCSPLMEEPDLLITGARPDVGGRLCSGDWRSCPGSRPARTAAAGTPDPGARVVRTWHMRVGQAPGPRPGRRRPARWARGAMSWFARCGSTTAAASVPATTTLWCSRAETTWPAQVACRLRPCFLSLASIRAWPSRLGGGGPGGDGPPRRRRAPGQGPSTCWRAGRDLGG